MTIRHQLLESLESRYAAPPVPRVTRVVGPPGGSTERLSPFTVVVLTNGAAGLCWNLLEDDQTRLDYDRLDLASYKGRQALEVAGELLHPALAHRLVGYAACSALSQVLFAAGDPAVGTTAELTEIIAPTSDDRVGVVGHSPPLVKELAARAGRVTVLERQSRKPVADNVELPDDVTTLASCNKVVLSSTTLLDDSFEQIDRITAGAAFRALYGPGAGILPDALFDRGFHAIAGTLVLDGATLAERQRTGQKWGDAKQKFVLTRQPSPKR